MSKTNLTNDELQKLEDHIEYLNREFGLSNSATNEVKRCIRKKREENENIEELLSTSPCGAKTVGPWCYSCELIGECNLQHEQ